VNSLPPAAESIFSQALHEPLETAEGLRNEGKEASFVLCHRFALQSISIAHKSIDQKKNGGRVSEAGLFRVFQLSFFNFTLQTASLNVPSPTSSSTRRKMEEGHQRLPQILHLYFFNFPQQTTKVIAKYTDYMSELPLPDQPPPSPPSELDPICYKSVKSFHAYLPQVRSVVVGDA
jgi:hypothetical protein